MKMAFLGITRAANKHAKGYFDCVPVPDSKSIKDPEKQAAWKKDKRAKMIEKAPLQATTGRIVSIGVLVKDTELGVSGKVIFHADEKKTLTEFAEFLKEQEINSVFLRKARTFNAPFLLRRFAANAVGIPQVLGPMNIQDIDYLTIGTNSSACPEITNVYDDMFLVGQSMKTPYLPDDIDVQESLERYEKGNDGAREDIIQAGKIASKTAYLYFNAFKIEGRSYVD